MSAAAQLFSDRAHIQALGITPQRPTASSLHDREWWSFRFPEQRSLDLNLHQRIPNVGIGL